MYLYFTTELVNCPGESLDAPFNTVKTNVTLYYNPKPSYIIWNYTKKHAVLNTDEKHQNMTHLKFYISTYFRGFLRVLFKNKTKLIKMEDF